MKMIKKTVSGFAIVICLIFSACSGNLVNFEQRVDHQNVDFSKGRKIYAEASGFQLLLFIPIDVNSRHDRAYRTLQAQAYGEYIGDIKIQESWTYGLVGTIYTTKLEATAYPLKK